MWNKTAPAEDLLIIGCIGNCGFRLSLTVEPHSGSSQKSGAKGEICSQIFE